MEEDIDMMQGQTNKSMKASNNSKGSQTLYHKRIKWFYYINYITWTLFSVNIEEEVTSL